MLKPGSVIAGYRVERLLGIGGMGSVYLAQNPELPRLDAIKVLSGELSRQPEFRARFVREADVASGLSHPNIVSVYSRGEAEDGSLWIAMQYVDGTDADDALKSGTMTPTRAVHVIAEVAKALDYAHQHKVVHRDVKPGNFLLSGEPGDDERVLLGDFGIAKALDDVGLTMTGSVVATMAYAAPEVLSGHAFDGRADIYSLACTLFRLLTGKTPFSAANGPAAVMMAHLHRPPPRVTDLAPRLPAALDGIIATGMAKDPAQRFRTAQDLAAAAMAVVHAHATSTTAPWGAVPSSDVSSYPQRQGGGQQWWQPESGPRTMLSPAAVPTRTGSATTTSTGSSRRRWIVGAVAAAALVAGGTTATVLLNRTPDRQAAPQPATTSTTTSRIAPPPPTVEPQALPAMLPTPGEAATAIGGTDVAVSQTLPVPFDNAANFASERRSCVGAWGAGQKTGYDGSAYQGFQAETLLDRADTNRIANATVAVASFPSAGQARQFLTGQQSAWALCNNVTLTLDFGDKGSRNVQLGAVATSPEGVLTLAETWPDQPTQLCQRALAVDNNVSVDVQACTQRPPEPVNRDDPAVVSRLNPAVTLLNTVLSKVGGP
jgi:eukaryotic-like serine/threonine-protein kinase